MAALILTDVNDSHADAVIEKLDSMGVKYYRLDLDVESLKHTYITLDDNKWMIVHKGRCIIEDDVSCVWCRRAFVELSLEEQHIGDADFRIWKNEWNKTLLGLYNSLKNRSWLSPLRKAYKGENKYYQLERAREVGFDVPDMIVSNQKERLLDFAKIHEKIIFKLMSQEMYDLGDEGFKGLYANVISIDDIQSFNKCEENPIVLQEYIEKQYEVRYTVVGDRHLVCKIDSQASNRAKEDWRRYDIPNTPHCIISPPSEIASKVKRFMRELGLDYGALDFIVTPDNEWIFLEINCMGQWLWIEHLTGLPIAEEIARWIASNV